MSIFGAIGSLFSGNAQAKAAKAQARAQEKALALQKEYLEKQEKALLPYREFGDVGLEGFQNLLSQEGRNQYLKDYFASDEYSTLGDQARDSVLAAAEATGGLQGSPTQNQLARIAPTLGLQNLNNQFGRYGTGIQTGLSAAGAYSGALQNSANSQSEIFNRLGIAKGAQASAYDQAAASFFGGLQGQQNRYQNINALGQAGGFGKYSQGLPGGGGYFNTALSALGFGGGF